MGEQSKSPKVTFDPWGWVRDLIVIFLLCREMGWNPWIIIGPIAGTSVAIWLMFLAYTVRVKGRS